MIISSMEARRESGVTSVQTALYKVQKEHFLLRMAPLPLTFAARTVLWMTMRLRSTVFRTLIRTEVAL